MPDLWMPGAKRMPTGRTVPLNGNGHKIFTWHTFEAPYTLTAENGAKYLQRAGSDPHFVFHPISGDIVQMLPMNTGARTLRGGTYVTNRYGSVHAQVEVIAYAKQPFTSDLTPAGRAALGRLLDFLRSWGIPDQWAMPRPPAYPGGSVRRGSPTRDGHAHHAGWIGNDHGDPGAIADPWTLTTPIGGTTAAPTPKETPLMVTNDDEKKITAIVQAVVRDELARVPALVWGHRFNLTDDDRRALASPLKSISAGGLLRTDARIGASKTDVNSLKKLVGE